MIKLLIKLTKPFTALTTRYEPRRRLRYGDNRDSRVRTEDQTKQRAALTAKLSSRHQIENPGPWLSEPHRIVVFHFPSSLKKADGR